MKTLSLNKMSNYNGEGCDGVDYWLGLAGGFTVAAGLATAGFGFVVGVVATSILAGESAACHGVYVNH